MKKWIPDYHVIDSEMIFTDGTKISFKNPSLGWCGIHWINVIKNQIGWSFDWSLYKDKKDMDRTIQPVLQSLYRDYNRTKPNLMMQRKNKGKIINL